MRKIIFWICLTLAVSNNALATDEVAHEALTLARSSSSWDGTPLPEYPKGTPEIVLLKITIAPGAELPVHKHPVINAGVVLSGELTVITEEGKVLHLKPGQALIEVVNKWHHGKNEGDIPVEILVFYASTPNTPLTINKQ